MVLGTVLAVLLATLPVTLVAVAIVRESGPTGPDHAEARSLLAPAARRWPTRGMRTELPREREQLAESG